VRTGKRNHSIFLHYYKRIPLNLVCCFSNFWDQPLSAFTQMFIKTTCFLIFFLRKLTRRWRVFQIMVWWFNTKVALHNGSSSHGGKHSVNSNSHASQHACSSLCDEIVVLWRLAALNPGLSPEERDLLHHQFKQWHIKIVDKVGWVILTLII